MLKTSGGKKIPGDEESTSQRCVATPTPSLEPTTFGWGLIPVLVRPRSFPIPTHTLHGSRRIIVTIGSDDPERRGGVRNAT